MKLIIAILLISVFFGVVIFGTFAMDAGLSYCYSLCIGAIKIFSTTVLLFGIFILIAVAAASLPVLAKTDICRKVFESYPYQLKFTHWLAMHENSPSAI